MHVRSLKIKLTALFLVAFVCLNAGGAVCVAYCQGLIEAFAESQDHCPLKKKESHCDPLQETDEQASAAQYANAEKIECCSMTLGFVGGPIEKTSLSFDTAAPENEAGTDHLRPAFFRAFEQSSPPAYRGPPLDRRVERIKHRLIRI